MVNGLVAGGVSGGRLSGAQLAGWVGGVQSCTAANLPLCFVWEELALWPCSPPCALGHAKSLGCPRSTHCAEVQTAAAPAVPRCAGTTAEAAAQELVDKALKLKVGCRIFK